MRKIGFVLLILMLLLGVVSAQAEDGDDLLADVVAEFVGEDDPALVVQVSTPEGTWSAAGGRADGERPTEVTDRFRIGSMSKTFVAVAALLLVEEGVFDLDDPASAWLPDAIVEKIANADSVTIRQLLAMRSGIDDYLGTDEFWEAVEDDPTRVWTAEEALEYAYGLPALFAPDEESYYSNSNYLLMQVILEAAAGMPLHSLIRERILDPLNLANTYTQISESLPGGFVEGYEDWDGDGELDAVSGINDGAGLGDGALISNVNDLTTFYRALLDEQTLLSEESLDELLAFEADDDGGYGLGLSSWETDFGEAWGHSGGVVGFLSIGVYLLDFDVIIIVLSASSEIAPEDVAQAAADALFG